MTFRRWLWRAVVVVLVVFGPVYLGLAISPRVSIAAAPNTSLTATIDHYLQTARRDWQIPGLAVAITCGDDIVYLRGLSNDGSITADTPFILGSLSKSFTSLAVMQLVDRGQLNLDAPVGQYLPWFRVANVGLTERITLRHLLHHTSGLSMETDLQFLDTRDSDRSPRALETSIRQLSRAHLLHPLGEFHYANINYNILGLIVESVAGQSFDQYVEQHIFQPLGMNHSYTSQIQAQRGQPALAKGYRFWLHRPVPTNAPFSRQNLPSGYIISSAHDMSTYLRFHLGMGSQQQGQLLSKTSLQQLHQPQVKAWGNDHYGMGWVIDQVGELSIAYHGGELVNFSSNMTIVPDRQWGIVILTNITPGIFGDPIRKLYLGLFNILKHHQPPVLTNDLGVQLLVFGLPIFVILQLALFLRSVARLLMGRVVRFKTFWQVAGYVVYPVVVDAGIAIGFLVYLPHSSKVSLSLMLFAQPDLAGLVIVSAAIALADLGRILVELYRVSRTPRRSSYYPLAYHHGIQEPVRLLPYDSIESTNSPTGWK